MQTIVVLIDTDAHVNMGIMGLSVCVCVCVCVCFPSTSALHTPVVNYTVVSANETARNISIKWRTPDSTKRDMEYVFSMRSSSHPKYWTTNLTHQSLTLTIHTGVRYTVTVVAQRCRGNVTSNSSNPLLIYFPGVAVSVLSNYVAG